MLLTSSLLEFEMFQWLDGDFKKHFKITSMCGSPLVECPQGHLWPHYSFTLSELRALPHLKHVRPTRLELFHISAIFQGGKKIECKKRIPSNPKNSEAAWSWTARQIFSHLKPLRFLKHSNTNADINTKTNTDANTNKYKHKCRYTGLHQIVSDLTPLKGPWSILLIKVLVMAENQSLLIA